MGTSPKDVEIPLRPQSSTLSRLSIGSNSTFVASPVSPSTRRPGYHRVPSVVEEGAVPSMDSVLHKPIDDGNGLGISNLDSQKRSSVPRVPVGSKALPSIDSPASTDPLVSPISAKSPKVPYKIHEDRESPSERDEHGIVYDFAPNPYQPFTVDSEREQLHTRNLSGSTIDRDLPCKAKKPLASGRSSWLAISILVLSVYSTCFSGSWLFIALVRPRYGHTITTTGKVSPQTASILCAAFAKTIELSFVTVFVAFVGQILSKRALGDRKSITIAEMSMRSWILQPGTMIGHWESVRYAAITYLGAAAVVAAIIAMVYTTASDALVAPKLKFGKVTHRALYGKVSTSFANTFVIMARCTTPIQEMTDQVDYQKTCIQLEHSGEAYHNYMQYLGTWMESIGVGNGSLDMVKRPAPVAMLWDNTTVTGTWIQPPDALNMTGFSTKWNRTANNVTMAMPHSGIVGAAKDPINGIVQPSDLSGLGEYYIQASVPSPVVNVLCAELTADELSPMVYTEWPGFKYNATEPNSTTWPTEFDLRLDLPNKTVVDDLFGFDEVQTHPIFPKLPIAYNTVFNDTKPYGIQAVHLLTGSPTNSPGSTANSYTLCQIQAALTPDCSTEYHSTGSGGSLNTQCSAGNRLAYIKSEPKAPNGMWNKDWVNVASEWGLALSLNDGISDGSAANARLLSQLIPTTKSLDTSLPSISEALAVLAGNTLLQSALDSPFIHYWNYSTTVATLSPPGQYQAFNATLKTMTYQSGGTQPWQRIFYLVLLLVFVANLCCLCYFLVSGNLVTDFIEPQNLFCLSLLSPPSETLEGACAGGPERGHYNSRWNIKIDKARDHVWLESNERDREVARKQRGVAAARQREYEMSPVARMYSRIRKKRSSML